MFRRLRDVYRRGRGLPAAPNEGELAEDRLIYSSDFPTLGSVDDGVPITQMDGRPRVHASRRIELHADVVCEHAQIGPSVDDVPVALKHSPKIHSVSWIVNSPCVASLNGDRYG